MVEQEQLDRLIEVHRPLLLRCATSTPDDIELSALAAMLHSFYTGIENLFKRIEVETDATLPRGESWHRELLDAMRWSSRVRPAVISAPLRDRLREYLEFCHVFRQAYSFQLRWDKMSPLVLDCEQTLRRLEAELEVFLQPRTDPDQR